jgi:hypothetical protein
MAERYRARVCGCSLAGIELESRWGLGFLSVLSVVCCRGISDMRTEDIEIHNG